VRRPSRRLAGPGRRRPLSAAAGALAAAVVAAAVAAPAGAAPAWRLEQPAPPAGAIFKVPLGAPGDITFYGPNRGLLAVEGNATIPRGLFAWNGQSWNQLSTVCGGPGDTTRIAWAGPREFWTITEPSLPRVGSGTALCRFRDGQVVGSFSTADQSPDPNRQMAAAVCTGASDCWFAGVGSQDPNGERVGAFHLHWDGAQLTSVYAPQGRAVTGIYPFGPTLWETTLVGQRPEDTTSEVDLAEPEVPKPRLIHRIDAGVFSNDPFQPSDLPGVPGDGTELLALDGDGTQVWGAGGGAASGPAAPAGGSVARPPIVVRLVNGAWQEVPIPAAAFGANDRIVDLAVVPGTDTAWAVVQPFAERRSSTAKAKVALIHADGTVEVTRLPTSGAGRGSAARIDCAAANDCWLATYAGWLFHWTDGTPQLLDTDPAFQSLVTFRPNEAAEQFVPDTPPADDSNLFAPAPPPAPVKATPAKTKVVKLPPLLRSVRSRLVGRTLVIRFRLVRKARVAVIGYRGRRIVARTPKKLMRPGQRVLRLRLNPKRWPTRLKFDTTEPGRKPTNSGGDETVTT
jgi:hypothetical protein